MGSRFVSIWFRHLKTDWFAVRTERRARQDAQQDARQDARQDAQQAALQDAKRPAQPDLRQVPFVLRTPSHGRMVITGVNAVARSRGITEGMVLADARAILPGLLVKDDPPGLAEKLLRRLGEWCIQFAPIVAADPPDGLLLEASGCPHLWGGDESYLANIVKKLNSRGYDVQVAMADTLGAAWAVARFGTPAAAARVIECGGRHIDALLALPPEGLRLEEGTLERLHKLGLHRISQLMNMPGSALRRRFGQHIITRLNQAMGFEQETIESLAPQEPYQERLPCLEPVVTAGGIEIAVRELLEKLCFRLQQEQMGLRAAVLKCFRVDGKVVKVEIGTSRPTHHVSHLFKLFGIKLPAIEPAMGIELFLLEASGVEEHLPLQEKLWTGSGGLHDTRIAELLDRLGGKVGMQSIRRYLPDEHYWPERSYKLAASLEEKPATTWRTDSARPMLLLARPERVEVSAPIPDYPPMLFRYRGEVHQVVAADGPERIEQEWWLQQGEHRDYYVVEDEAGHRYWLFRLGHYSQGNDQWYVHGMFA